MIKSANDNRTFEELLRSRNIKEKTLFPLDWDEEKIIEAFAEAERRIKDVLLKEYGLPEYSPENAGKYWKNVK